MMNGIPGVPYDMARGALQGVRNLPYNYSAFARNTMSFCWPMAISK